MRTLIRTYRADLRRIHGFGPEVYYDKLKYGGRSVKILPILPDELHEQVAILADKVHEWVIREDTYRYTKGTVIRRYFFYFPRREN